MPEVMLIPPVGWDKFHLLEPPATSTMSPMMPLLPPGTGFLPATVHCPSYLKKEKKTNVLFLPVKQPNAPFHQLLLPFPSHVKQPYHLARTELCPLLALNIFWPLSQSLPPAHPPRSTLLKMIYCLLPAPSQAAPLQTAGRTRA